MKSFDAIIIGAGPAGLLLGKEISKKHSVLILEKSKVGKTNKNWLTYEDRWRKEGFPEKFIGNRFKKWFVQMSHEGLSNEFVIKDNFICFDEHKFLKYLANMIIKEGGAILEENPSLSFKRSKEGVIVNNKYKAPLLIDCSGVGSLIVRKHKLVDLPIYINCYAYIGEFNNLKNKVVYLDVAPSELLKQFRFDLSDKLRPITTSESNEDKKNKNNFNFHSTIAFKDIDHKFNDIMKYLSRKNVPNIRQTLLRVTIIRNHKIFYEYDFLQKKLLNRRQSLSRIGFRKTIRRLKQKSYPKNITTYNIAKPKKRTTWEKIKSLIKK